jgi:hypothetical protein
MWDIKVGDRVTPIKSIPRSSNRYQHEVWPVAGVVYTVRDISVMNTNEGPLPCIRLVEIINKPDRYMTEPGVVSITETGFKLKCFRKVISNKGMDELTKFLSNPQSKVTNNGFDKKVKRKTRA